MSPVAVGPAFVDLPAADGGRYSLSSFDAELLVVVFLGNGCPTAKSSEDVLIDLHGAYADRGVGLVAVNPNNPFLSPPDTLAEMAKRSALKRYPFPYLKDADGQLARACGVTRTPEVVVLDGGRQVRYQGRVLDARDPARARRRDLQEALDDLLAGRGVRVPVTDALGCSIVW